MTKEEITKLIIDDLKARGPIYEAITEMMSKTCECFAPMPLPTPENDWLITWGKNALKKLRELDQQRKKMGLEEEQ